MQKPNVDQRLHDIFCQYGVMKTFNTGQFLVEKGQPAAYSCYITSGYARTLCCNSDGNEIVLFYIEPNNMICSEALLLDAIVNVSVQAISPVEMYMIPGEKLSGQQQKSGILSIFLLHAFRSHDSIQQ